MSHKPQKISTDDIPKAIEDLDGWEEVRKRDAICKSFKFKDFKQAFDFMNAVAQYAEEIGHHPEWFNVYNRIDVTLNTHDVGGLSDLDIKMARKMNTLV